MMKFIAVYIILGSFTIGLYQGVTDTTVNSKEKVLIGLAWPRVLGTIVGALLTPSTANDADSYGGDLKEKFSGVDNLT